MSAIITTDLHLSEKAEDQYRFDLFPWINSIEGHDIDTVIIAGDLTDRKNFHADWFVNKVVQFIRNLAQKYQVFILKGNHDYDADPDHPFFRFLGKYHRVAYISKPRIIPINEWGVKMLFLPHSRDPEKDWGKNLNSQKEDIDAVFTHQTFNGATAESGERLGGISTKIFRNFSCPIFSGDIHVPQQVGPVTYIGCPYHIHYGDKFTPRVLLADRNFETEEFEFPAPHKLVVDIKNFASTDRKLLNKAFANARSGDRVKVKVHLPRADFDWWPTLREEVREYAAIIGVQLHSVVLKEVRRKGRERLSRRPIAQKKTHPETYAAYCKRYEVDQSLEKLGRVFMEEG